MSGANGRPAAAASFPELLDMAAKPEHGPGQKAASQPGSPTVVTPHSRVAQAAGAKVVRKPGAVKQNVQLVAADAAPVAPSKVQVAPAAIELLMIAPKMPPEPASTSDVIAPLDDDAAVEAGTPPEVVAGSEFAAAAEPVTPFAVQSVAMAPASATPAGAPDRPAAIATLVSGAKDIVPAGAPTDRTPASEPRKPVAPHAEPARVMHEPTEVVEGSPRMTSEISQSSPARALVGGFDDGEIAVRAVVETIMPAVAALAATKPVDPQIAPPVPEPSFAAESAVAPADLPRPVGTPKERVSIPARAGAAGSQPRPRGTETDAAGDLRVAIPQDPVSAESRTKEAHTAEAGFAQQLAKVLSRDEAAPAAVFQASAPTRQTQLAFATRLVPKSAPDRKDAATPPDQQAAKRPIVQQAEEPAASGERQEVSDAPVIGEKASGKRSSVAMEPLRPDTGWRSAPPVTVAPAASGEESRETAAPAAPAARAPIGPVELAADPPTVAHAAHEIRLQLSSGGEQRVEVRLVERAGDVQVAVRTPDPALAGALRQELPALSARLEQAGFHAENWHTGLAVQQNSAATEGVRAGTAQNQQNRPGQERGQQQDARQPSGDRQRQRKDDGKDFAWLFTSIP